MEKCIENLIKLHHPTLRAERNLGDQRFLKLLLQKKMFNFHPQSHLQERKPNHQEVDGIEVISKRLQLIKRQRQRRPNNHCWILPLLLSSNREAKKPSITAAAAAATLQRTVCQMQCRRRMPYFNVYKVDP